MRPLAGTFPGLRHAPLLAKAHADGVSALICVRMSCFRALLLF